MLTGEIPTLAAESDDRCAQIAVTGHQGFTTYAMVAGYDNVVGEYIADDRVGAVIGVASFVKEFTDERLASIDIPALLMIGTEHNDGASATRPWELPNSSPSYRVDLAGRALPRLS